MQISVTINACRECRHSTHHGAFGPVSCVPICGHGGRPANPAILRFNEGEDAMLKAIRALRSDRLQDDAKARHRADYLAALAAWRIVPDGTIPDWCPLRHGARY